MKQLIEDYKKKIETLANDLRLYKSTGSINDIKKVERLTTKLFEYRTFVVELERLNVHDETVCTNGFKIPTGMLDKNKKMIHENDILPDQTPQLVNRIDFSMLRTQKKSLIKIIDEYELNKNVMVSKLLKESEASDLNGILNLIDSIQDFACDVMGMNPIDIFDFELEEGREDVIKPEDVTKLTYSVITDDVINNIVERKKQGIDCTEKESAEIKGWLRELKLPEEQTHVATIQLLFPIEYGEFLNEI